MVVDAMKTATMEDNVTEVHELVLAGRRLIVREIAKTSQKAAYVLYEI